MARAASIRDRPGHSHGDHHEAHEARRARRAIRLFEYIEQCERRDNLARQRQLERVVQEQRAAIHARHAEWERRLAASEEQGIRDRLAQVKVRGRSCATTTLM